MVSKEQVEYIAKLARLRLTASEVEKMQKDLAEILDYINLLKEADIAQFSEDDSSFNLQVLKNIQRSDIAEKTEKEDVEAMLNQVPQKQGNFVKVKEVL